MNMNTENLIKLQKYPAIKVNKHFQFKITTIKDKNTNNTNDNNR